MSALSILRHFRRMGTPLARLSYGSFAALSQYGYAMAYYPTRKQAVRHTLAYYANASHLLTQ